MPLPRLLLLHGATLNQCMWDPVRRSLPSSWQILTPDLPGHGRKRDQRYTVAAAVDTVVAAAQSVFPAPVVLVGDSLGAYTAMASASSLPGEQLQGLVLGGSTFDFKGAAAYPAVFRGALMRTLAGVFGEERMIEKLMPKALTAFGLNDADGRRIIDAGMSIRAFGQAVAAVRREDFIAILARIQQPVLIVNGSCDKPCIRQEARFIAAAKQATAHRFECGHGVSLWRPKEFAALIDDFARRAQDAPTASRLD